MGDGVLLCDDDGDGISEKISKIKALSRLSVPPVRRRRNEDYYF